MQKGTSVQNLTFFIFTLLCISLQVTAQEETLVFVDGNEIHYQGGLNKEANNQLISLYKKNPDKITGIVIRSKGGEINIGLDLAEFVFTNKLNVKVTEYCLSSCANYVFTAASNKILGNTALVAFHGGATSTVFDTTEIDEMIKSFPLEQQESIRIQTTKQFKEYINNTSARETEFYNKIQVSQSITTLGQTPYYEAIYGTDEYEGWYYSFDDLDLLGVKNISVINSPWLFKQLFDNAKVFKVEIVGI